MWPPLPDKRVVLGLFVAATAVGVFLLAEPGSTEHAVQRAVLAATGACLLAVRWAWARARPAATAAVLIWVGLVIGATLGSDVPRVATGRLNPWSHYHYILGSKYFPELGYTGLYEQTLAAAPAIEVHTIRDLSTYERVLVRDVAPARSEVWTDERWAAFQQDLSWFQPRVEWRAVLRDRGYNATPTGNALYRQLARLPVREGSLRVAGLLDPLLLTVAFGAAASVFGPVRALVAAAWLLLFFGNEHRVVGYPLQYDYVAALLLTACAWRRGWPAVAGGLLAYAAMVRVFPGLLVAGVGVWAVGRWWGGHGIDRRAVRFGGGLLVGCVLLAAAGSLSSRGPGAWVQWADNISLHAESHRTGERRIGMQHLFTYQAQPNGDWPSEGARQRAWQDRQVRWVGAAALGSLLWLASGLLGGRRGDDLVPHLALALWLVFAGVVVSRYYWSAAVLLILLGPGRDERGEGELIGAGLLALVAAHYAFALWEHEPYPQYLFSNGLLLVGWLALLLIRTASAASRTAQRA